MKPVSLKGRIESSFETFGRLMVRWRWFVLVSAALVTGGLASSLPDMRADNSMESFLRENHPELLRYNEFRARFDRDDRVIVILQPKEIFSFEFLSTLRNLHHDLEAEVPYVEEITSLLNARNTRGEADELIVEDLLARWPADDRDLEELANRVLGNPLYINTLVNEGAEYTTIVIKPFTYSTLGPETDVLGGFDEEGMNIEAAREPAFLTAQENHALVDAVRATLDRYQAPDLQIHLLGGPLIDTRIDEMLEQDVARFLSLGVLVCAVLMFWLLRRPSAVILPLVAVTSALLASFGLMVQLNIPMSVVLQILPAFLLVVGLCDSVHILVIVYQQLSEGRGKEDAIAFALAHSGLAVVMTSVTTALGLLSFVTAELAPVGHLGIIAPIGVLLAMVYSLTLLPALLAVIPIEGQNRHERGPAPRLNGVLAALGDLATRHPWRVVIGTGLFMCIALAGLLQVRFSHDAMRWFPEHEPLRVAAELVDDQFEGGTVIEVLVDSGRENGLHEPAVLRRLEDLMRHAEALVLVPPVGKATSIVDISKEIHRALNENRPEAYVLPERRKLVAQEFLLFENSGSDDLSDVTDTQFRTARITLRTTHEDAILYQGLLERLSRDFRTLLGEEMDFELTGAVPLFSSTHRAVILSMARSYGFALLVITPVMILMIGSVGRGLVAMIPNLVPIYFVLALMGAAEIPLDVSTVLVGSIAIGLAVDDTIHFMHKFDRYLEETGDPRIAVHQTLATTGAALLFTSLLLIAGSSVFLFAYMINAVHFGLLIGFAALVAFLADILLAPSLMVLFTRYTQRGRHGRAG
jgi:predicted RND superfamily exporter protein